MSFAKKTNSPDVHERTKAANHFVIFDTQNVIACHDFEYIDIIPDLNRQSCHSHYNKTLVNYIFFYLIYTIVKIYIHRMICFQRLLELLKGMVHGTISQLHGMVKIEDKLLYF